MMLIISRDILIEGGQNPKQERAESMRVHGNGKDLNVIMGRKQPLPPVLGKRKQASSAIASHERR